ncbi:putative protein kinase RLK-Pelle-L-LEC family [Helianthus anomalus]
MMSLLVRFGAVAICGSDADSFSDGSNEVLEAYTIASRGGYTYYRAELHCFDKENPSSKIRKNKGDHPKGHNIVVIKRYPSGKQCFGEEELFTEIEMVSSVEHPNIVTLIGFCIEDSEMIFVIENVSNGYLDDYLGNDNDMRILTWEKRLKICIEVANALEHLHSEMEDQNMIIHRDIVAATLGWTRTGGQRLMGLETVYIVWCGISEYIDPEYEKTDKLKRESDSDKGLGPVARQSFSTGTLEDMIDPILKEETSEYNFVLTRVPNKESLHAFMKIADQCVAETQDQRPTIKVVVKELEKALSSQVSQRSKTLIFFIHMQNAR